MRILIVGNSHVISVSSAVKADKQIDHKNNRIDIIPLNLCPDHQGIIAEGKGIIRFRPNTLPDFHLDASTYDKIVFVGCFVGGDGIFRALIKRTCFTRNLPEELKYLRPDDVAIGHRGATYMKPVFVDDAGDAVPPKHRLVSSAALDTMMTHQINFRLKLFNVEGLRRIVPRIFWVESPFPKKSVFDKMWGEYYTRTNQAPYLQESFRRALAKSGMHDLCTFIDFPNSMRSEGPYLSVEHESIQNPLDIHAGKSFGEYIINEATAR